MALLGGIEAGGTKFVCAIGTGPNDIRAEARFPTTTPNETIQQVVDFFKAREPVAAIGIASFGPVDPDPNSATFGYITTTPKRHWAQTDLAGPIGHTFNVPIGFDTDVNGAALGEHRWGAAQGLDTFVYLTIGTGLGGGGMVGGQLMHGLMHPEMGHMIMPRDPEVDSYGGSCPFHQNCWEGLAAGPSIEQRWGQKAETLPPDHAAWDLEAHYLALGLQNIICIMSPQRIIMGGGVMAQQHLFPKVRQKVVTSLNGYIQSPSISEAIDTYIVPPRLGNQAGVLGAFALAQMALG